MSWNGEIHPASMEQVRQGRDGKMVTIEEDVANVAQDLKRIDPRLHLRWSEKGKYFVVYCREPHEPEGTGHLVGTYQELDQRIVKSIEETVWKWKQPGYSFSAELEKQEDEAIVRADEEWSEQFGETAERLAWAIRKDLDFDKAQMIVPKEIPNGNS